jgi:predicted ATPase/class 3 adenylate cyclase
VTVCAECGAESPAGQKFCGECGNALAVACRSCGTPGQPGQKFCGECGAPLVAGARRAARPVAPATERRLVSVLFADLVGFTSLSESRDAEEVRELLTRYFDACRRLIELYGGTVEKFIGDAVMAVWGTPVATEDDAERAVRAALELVSAVAALGDEVGAPELRARAGVLTGEAAVNLGAVGQGMVAGDLVNTASRIQSAAEPGAVLVGQSTRRASESAVAYEAAGAHALKGKEEPVPLWRALRVVSGVRGELRSEGLEAPFVGRDSELRRIKELFHACAEERRTQLVSVTGMAGIGKSRLAWEFYKYVDGLVDLVLWHRGRCPAYGDGVAYWALAEMVRWRCRIAEDERGDTALAKLRATLAEHVPDTEERRFVEPRLARLLGLGGASDGDRQDLFAGWRLFFERLAAEAPVVLVFEDIQWADTSLLDFVEYLREWSPRHGILVVTLARSDLLERRPTWGAGRRAFTSLHLEPLPEHATRELLAGLVPGLPEEAAERILARAEGVPLYAMETVRMLLDRGLLVQDGTTYAVAGEIGALEVPETLHALIASRLDGLSDPERQLLKDAAVLGETFTRPALAALANRPEQELEPLLAALVRKEVLGVQADLRSPEHGQYGFLQDLVRRVAYETLSKRERRTRHLAAARQLTAALGEEEGAEVAAAHLLAAYRELPDAADAEELRTRAVAALVRAAERAASVAAAGEASGYFEQAAELTAEPSAQAELVFRAGEMALRAGQAAEARTLLERAHRSLEARGDTRAAARVSIVLADLDWLDARPEQAVSRLEQALAALDEGEADADVAHVSAQLGRFLVFAGGPESAATHLERALALAQELALPQALASALSSKALALDRRGRHEEALIVQNGALEYALRHELHREALRAYNNLGVYFRGRGRWAEANETCAPGLELARRLGDRTWEAVFLATKGGGIELGRWDERLAALAEADLETGGLTASSQAVTAVPILCERGALAEARALLERIEGVAPTTEAQAVCGRRSVEAYLLRSEGRPREALEAAERAREAGAALGPGDWRVARAEVEAVEAALAAGDEQLARELLARSQQRAPGELTPFLRAEHARLRARLEPARAHAELDAAEDLYRQLHAPFQLALTLASKAERLAAEEAAPLLAEAREIFERLGARPRLEHVAALEARAQPAAAATRS